MHHRIGQFINYIVTINIITSTERAYWLEKDVHEIVYKRNSSNYKSSFFFFPIGGILFLLVLKFSRLSLTKLLTNRNMICYL